MITDFEEKNDLPSEWYSQPPSVGEIPEGTFVVITDAGYKRRLTGVGVIIRTKGREYTPKEHGAICKGPNHAELTSVKMGLRDITKIRKEVKRVVVYNDNLWGHWALRGFCIPERDYIWEVLGEIEELNKDIGCQIDYIHVPGKAVKRVDRIADKVRKRREGKKEKQIKKRMERVQTASERGTGIEILEKNGNHYALSASKPDKAYRVTLQPPSCECRAWMMRYGKLEMEAILARALPCKHLCALAEYTGRDIFAEFERQIWRSD